MQEFQKYYEAMSEMNIESRRFLVSLITAFFYYDVSYNGCHFFNENNISVTVKDDRCILSICTRGEDKYGNKYCGDIINIRDILEFSVFENITAIKLYCREFDFQDKHNIPLLHIIYRLGKTNSCL